jgi:hypothetical protein
MMSGMPLETCWDFNQFWNNKFYYKVVSCWLFLLSHTTMHRSMNIKVSKILRNYKIIENWRNCVKKKKLRTMSSNSYIVRSRGIYC